MQPADHTPSQSDQGFEPEEQTLWGFALYTTGLLGALIAFTELLSSGVLHRVL